MRLSILFLPIFAMLPSAQAAPGATKDLADLLQPILEDSKLPSLAAAVVVGEELRGIGAVGVRKLGDRAAVTVDDRYHLGSCTKPMTATLAAILVEEGLLEWDSTVGEVLDKKVRDLNDDYRDVTLEQLLAHVGGLPGQAPPDVWAEAHKDQGRMSATRQRLNFVKALLSEEPTYPPGTKTVYSNQGYAVAGVMLETVARKSWEDLLEDRVFKPLDMKSAGYRPPEGRQPWGHQGVLPTRHDNPDAIGPAGTVHASIGDWMKFARFHLARKPGTLLKKEESFDKLNAALENSGQHSIGGWAIAEKEELGGRYIWMAGSNTYWFSVLRILPGKDTAIVVTTNSGQRNARETCNRVADKLIEEFVPGR